jgi:hypothetical protein
MLYFNHFIKYLLIKEIKIICFRMRKGKIWMEDFTDTDKLKGIQILESSKYSHQQRKSNLRKRKNKDKKICSNCKNYYRNSISYS